MTENNNSESKKMFNQEHYDFLISCIKKDENDNPIFDTDKWNDFKKELNKKKETVLLKGAVLIKKHLEGANLYGAHLEEMDFTKAHLEGADFENAYLEEAKFSLAIIDGKTLFYNCSFNKKTDTRGVGLNNCRFSPGLKLSFEYVNRRLNWIDWYEKQSKLPFILNIIKIWIVNFFWERSNYGCSLQKIV